MDNSRGAVRARTARLQIPGCCTVSVRSQLGRTLLPEYGKFHSRVQPWSGNVRRRPIQKFVCRGTAHWLRFMAVFVCFLAVIGVGMVSDAALMQRNIDGQAEMIVAERPTTTPDSPGHALLAGCATELARSEEHTSELQSLMRISYAVFCLKKKQLIKYLNHIQLSITKYQTDNY